jgi:LacI family transcriptional regulator
MAVTIYDIAQKTGYSAATISKALNNRSDISEATRLRIVTAARAMGYVPNQGAKGLVTKKNWLIGVIYEELDQNLGIEHPLFGGIMNAFKQTIEKEGYELIFLATNLGQRKMTYLQHCRYRGVDGVLILNNDVHSAEVLEVARSDIPSVSANLIYDETTSVTSENVLSSMEAVCYLHRLGHTRIAHIAGPLLERASAGIERLEGYRRGLKLCGIPYREDLVVVSNLWTEVCGFRALRQLMDGTERPTALFSASDIFSVGVYRAAWNMGLEIPRDLSIVSFDDNEVAGYLRPTLTTWRQNRREIGTVAGNLVLRKIAGQPTEKRILIPVEFMERESSQSLVAWNSMSSIQ